MCRSCEVEARSRGKLYGDRSWVERMYVEKGMSMREVAAEAGCSLRTIARWIKIHGIEIHKSRDLRGDSNPRWKGGPTCVDCGERRSYGASRCRPCRDGRYVGSGNPNWKGHADVMTLVRRWAKDYWRPAVFERDGYKCVACGSSEGGNLNAHHVEPLAAIVDRLRESLAPNLNSAEGRMGFVLDVLGSDSVRAIENGQTMCEECHRREHEQS